MAKLLMAAKSKMTTDGRRVNVAAPRRKTNDFLATQNLAQAAIAEDERQLKRLQAMETSQLVALGARCLHDQQAARIEYDRICAILAERFPQAATEETLVTPAGVAERVVRNEYLIDQTRVPDLRALLDKNFAEYVTSKEEYSVPPDRIYALRDELGARAKKFIKEDIVYKPTPLLRSHLRERKELAVRLKGIVRVATKITITITPVTPVTL